MSLFPPVNRRIARCPACGHPVSASYRTGVDEEEVRYACPKCGYTVTFVILRGTRKEWFPKSWVEATLGQRLNRG